MEKIKNDPFAFNGYDMIKTHKKSEHEITPISILKRAKEFLKAFERCDMNINRESLFVPAYTNLALSSELCLKAILKNENNEYSHEHDLYKLFLHLKQNVKDNLLIKYNKYFKLHMNVELKQKIFESNLKGIATTFYDYRYEYEWGTGKGLIINDAFFRCFAFAIFEYANETIKS